MEQANQNVHYHQREALDDLVAALQADFGSKPNLPTSFGKTSLAETVSQLPEVSSIGFTATPPYAEGQAQQDA